MTNRLYAGKKETNSAHNRAHNIETEKAFYSLLYLVIC